MEQNLKRVDYIIKSHNELPYLILMLRSLKYNNPDVWPHLDIKVFANNCTDGTQEWCDENDIWCRSVDMPGLYSIWNLGASMTDNEFMIFSASDFYLSKDFWQNIAAGWYAGEGFYYHYTGTCLDNGISYPHPDIPERRWYNRDCGDNWQEFDIRKCEAFFDELKTEEVFTYKETSYCPFLTTREHYNFLNGFNTELGDYPTDIDHDFLRRGKEAGRECCIVNNSFFYHFGKKSLMRRDGLNYDWKQLGGL